jgi:DNA transposition AAA+ family ATPase
MNINPGKTTFSEAEHEALRAEIASIRNGGVVQAQIAREADVAEATLSQYLAGTYKSEPGRTNTAASLSRWLSAREKAAAMRKSLPVAPEFRPLRASKGILATLSYARETGRLVVIAGSPGTGKTATARQFAAATPRTWYAPMDPSTGGVPTMLLEVLAAMGDLEARGTPQVLVRKVCQRAMEAKGLLIVDEAQHISAQAIETLRAINDRIRLGIVLMGNETAHQRIGATGVKVEFAQVSSRIAQRRYIATPDPRDAAELTRAWAEVNREEISDAEVAFCQTIAAKPGGLRNIEMTMEGALIAARGSGEPLGLAHLQSAFAQLSGLALAR